MNNFINSLRFPSGKLILTLFAAFLLLICNQVYGAEGDIIWTQTENPSTGTDTAFAVAVDASGIYVVGNDNSPGNWQWRIQKRGHYIDIGLRIYDGSQIIGIACEPAGTLTSPLRIRKGTTTYGIVLVATTDANASPIRINTSSGVKALRKY